MNPLADLYAAHVEHLTEAYHQALEATGYDAVVVHAGRLELKSPFDDQEWPFLPVPAFSHWADVSWPDSAIVVRQGRAAELHAMRATSFWERPKAPDFDLLRRGLEIFDVTKFAHIKERVDGIGKVAFIGNDPGPALELGISEEGYVPSDLLDALHAIRTRKTEYEVACMLEASRVAARGHHSIAEAFAAGLRSELDLHLTYLMATEQDDAQTPYKNIVALGASAAVLHHVSYGEDPDAGSLLVDAGARHRGYNSDITRTHVAEGSDAATTAFSDLLEGMEALQLAVIDDVEIGKPYESLHDRTHEMLGGLLVDVGLAKVSKEACVETGLTRLLFPHGLGHSLGVQVHDVGMRSRSPREDNQFLRNTSTIEAGQVFTIEPGLYFIDSLLGPARAGAHAKALDWSRVDQLRPFGGIRIEDNVAVLPEGSEQNVRNLTREAFAALDEG